MIGRWCVDVSGNVIDVSDTWIQSNLWAKSPFRAMTRGEGGRGVDQN